MTTFWGDNNIEAGCVFVVVAGDGALTLQELIQKTGGTDSPGLEAQFNFYDKMDGTTDQRVTRTAAVLAFQKALDANGKLHNTSNM